MEFKIEKVMEIWQWCSFKCYYEERYSLLIAPHRCFHLPPFFPPSTVERKLQWTFKSDVSCTAWFRLCPFHFLLHFFNFSPQPLGYFRFLVRISGVLCANWKKYINTGWWKRTVCPCIGFLHWSHWTDLILMSSLNRGLPQSIIKVYASVI